MTTETKQEQARALLKSAMRQLDMVLDDVNDNEPDLTDAINESYLGAAARSIQAVEDLLE